MSRNVVVVRASRACLLALCLSLSADNAAKAADRASEPIHSGLVVIDGQLLPRPYTVDATDSEITVNGQPVGNIPAASAATFPFADDPANAAIANIERLLLQEGLLLRNKGTVLLLPGASSDDCGVFMAEVMTLLTSELPQSEKLLQLVSFDEPATRHMTTQRGVELSDLLRLNRPLADQIVDLSGVALIDPSLDVAMNDAIDVDGEELHVEPKTVSADISESVQYGVNLFGMLAGVIALGSLLSSRPDVDRPWRELNVTATGLKLVARCGGLIVLLGLFDLVCTLMAIHTGMFRELNPVASQFTSSPLTVVIFKLAAMAAGVGLLWRLRQYSGAQTAAWWMCLVCTLVVFRWLTFHSMFIA
jgi:hypothetical protein